MDKAERVILIMDAMQMIEEAQQMVDDAVHDTEFKRHYEAYGRYGFDQLLGNGNPYDASLDTLIREFEEKYGKGDGR